MAVVTVVAAVTGSAAATPSCTIVGTTGADNLVGTPHRDLICGGGGPDTIKGFAGNDRLLGGLGNDALIGGKGDDTLLGGPGNDRLRAGRGRDFLYGGTGSNSCPNAAATDFVDRCRHPDRPHLTFPGVPPPTQLPQLCGSYTQPPDECPPVLYSVSVSPHSADITLGPVDLEVSVEAKDESPIAFVRAEIRGPGGFVRKVSLTATNQLEYEFVGATSLSETSPTGTYWVDRVTLADELGNTVVFDKAGLAAGNFGYARELEVYEGPDNVDPELVDLDISPPTVDTSGGPATVTMTVHATDQLSGVESIGGSFDMPNTPSDSGFPMSRVRGGAPDGEWEIEIQLPRHAAPGQWKLDDLHLWDDAGNATHYFDPADLEPLGFPLTFTQTGPGDTTPPQILGLSIEETAFSGQPFVYFYVHLSDDLSGIAVENFCLSLKSRSLVKPSYEMGITSPVQVSGTALDGVLRVGTTFPQAAPTGTYALTSIEACDEARNPTELSGAALEGKGWDLTFENPP
ncbi:MAG TPA: calcium-binding protein [Solirubrobacterales bacterium]